MVAVGEGNSFRRAIEMYGVPRATLHNHYCGRHDNGKAHPRPYLSFGEEELVVYSALHAKIGYP
uniref:HTH psq-type domain-containing protein n=1 Tax=Amphimedon queenslandica TaxID=400682 RepID=A0A1X7VL56_AMPQE